MKSLFALFSKIKHEYISYYLDMPSIFLTSQLQKISQITFKAHHQLDRQMHYLKTSAHEGNSKFDVGFFLSLAFSPHIRGRTEVKRFLSESFDVNLELLASHHLLLRHNKIENRLRTTTCEQGTYMSRANRRKKRNFLRL